MKVIIPIAGAGYKTVYSGSNPKALIPIAGKTVLSIIIEQFKDKGIKEFVFIVGQLSERVEEYVRKNYSEIKSHFIYQIERRGIAKAIGLTEEIVKNDEIIIVLGDTICEFDVKQFLKTKSSVVCIKKVDDPRQFGVVEVDEDDNIKKVAEKPNIPTSNLAMVGIYKIKETQVLFNCIKTLFSSVSGQHKQSEKNFSLTDCLDLMLKMNITLKTQKVNNWFDCGNIETLINTNSVLLNKFGNKVPKKSVQIINSVFIEPVNVPSNCKIENSIIGPNVTIGEHTQIANSVINNSIICAHSKIDNAVLKQSFIGSNAEVKVSQKFLNIGDDTNIDF